MCAELQKINDDLICHNGGSSRETNKITILLLLNSKCQGYGQEAVVAVAESSPYYRCLFKNKTNNHKVCHGTK